MRNKTGRPPIYKSEKQMRKKIDEYFKLCEGEMLLDENGNPVFSDKGYILYKVPPKPPTVTGLALFLGFTGRQALLNYQDKEEFMDTITRAKSRIEE